jgi:hypothetical protein
VCCNRLYARFVTLLSTPTPTPTMEVPTSVRIPAFPYPREEFFQRAVEVLSGVIFMISSTTDDKNRVQIMTAFGTNDEYGFFHPYGELPLSMNGFRGRYLVFIDRRNGAHFYIDIYVEKGDKHDVVSHAFILVTSDGTKILLDSDVSESGTFQVYLPQESSVMDGVPEVPTLQTIHDVDPEQEVEPMPAPVQDQESWTPEDCRKLYLFFMNKKGDKDNLPCSGHWNGFCLNQIWRQFAQMCLKDSGHYLPSETMCRHHARSILYPINELANAWISHHSEEGPTVFMENLNKVFDLLPQLVSVYDSYAKLNWDDEQFKLFIHEFLQHLDLC